MKHKLFSLLVFSVLFIMASCTSHGSCPAYQSSNENGIEIDTDNETKLYARVIENKSF